MKSGITRWKIVPSYSLPWVGCLVRGSVHSRVPSARSTKFRTVLGAWSGKSRTVIVPRFVRSFAVSVFVMTGILARPGGQPASRPAHGAWVAAAAAVSHLPPIAANPAGYGRRSAVREVCEAKQESTGRLCVCTHQEAPGRRGDHQRAGAPSSDCETREPAGEDCWPRSQVPR